MFYPVCQKRYNVYTSILVQQQLQYTALLMLVVLMYYTLRKFVKSNVLVVLFILIYSYLVGQWKKETMQHRIHEQNGEKLAAILLQFPISETPSWHRNEDGVTPCTPIRELFSDIVKLKRKYCQDSVQDVINKRFRDDFILQMSRDEQVGVQSIEGLKLVTE